MHGLLLVLGGMVGVAADPAEGLNGRVVNDPEVQRMRVICGPNSLYLLLRSWGIVVDFRSLERRLPMTRRGASLLALKRTAAHFGLPTTIRRCRFEALREARLPAIVHLNSSFRVPTPGEHYILLVSISRDIVKYIDGTTGRHEAVTPGKFRTSWSGYLVEPDRPRIVAIDPGPRLPWLLGGMCVAAGCLIRGQRRHRRVAISAVILLAFSPATGRAANPGADDPDVPSWRTPAHDAVNSLDLYLRLTASPAPRGRIRNALGPHPEAASLADLERASRTLGRALDVRRASPATLARMPFPIIVHLVDERGTRGGYAVLFRMDGKEVEMIPGATATIELMPMDAFRRRWSGFVLAPANRRDSWAGAAALLAAATAGWGVRELRRPRAARVRN